MKDFGREVVPAHCVPQQKAEARHHAIAVLDGDAALHQVQLEQADVVWGGRLR
jgi:hypothetical protein